MQEWLNWHAWKACNRLKRFGGSNPPLSAEGKELEVDTNSFFVFDSLNEKQTWMIYNISGIAGK